MDNALTSHGTGRAIGRGAPALGATGHPGQPLDHSVIRILDLFRISDFEFRISQTKIDNLLSMSMA
jgi:hypothetical protein